MIVRCNNCVSAFAVDDEKVTNKKFAFTCPKCSTENIIDNRTEEKMPAIEESVFNDDFSIEDDIPEKSTSGKSDDIFFDDTPDTTESDKKKFSGIEDDFDTDLTEIDLDDETVKKDRNLNLEIEETSDFSGFDDEDIFAEKTPSDVKEKSDDLLSEIPAFDADDDLISFDDEKPAGSSPDEFEIELKEDSIKTGEDDIFLDDFDETPSKTSKKEDSFGDSLDDETAFDFDDIETEKVKPETDNEREKKLSSQDDIDALFAGEGIEFDEKPISKKDELEFEDEITVDLDMLDIDLDEGSENKSDAKKDLSSDDITLDIDNLDIDLEETSPDTDIFSEPAVTEKQKSRPLTADDDITLDIDNLDIDLDDSSSGSDLFEESKPAKQKTVPADDDITLDIDNLDIDLDDSLSGSDIFEESKPVKKKTDPSDEDITLDIDNLDIDLDDTSFETDIFEEPAAVENSGRKKIPVQDEFEEEDIKLNLDELDIDLDEATSDNDILPEPAAKKASVSVKSQPSDDDGEFNEEDIKLNLDELDIDLDEIGERELIFEDDAVEKSAASSGKRKQPHAEEDDEDESIIIDLDTLEIELAEETSPSSGDFFEEDDKLTINDIDPDLTLDEIAESAGEEDIRLTDTLDELPEIDLDEYDAIVRREESSPAKGSSGDFEDDFVIFPEVEMENHTEHNPDYDMFEYEESETEISSPEKGSTFFSIDFSLKYSRFGALLRLLMLYGISMIPHFIVMLLYTLLSSIVGFINQIVVLSTGRCVEDFALVIENTMRYFFYIQTNIIGIVEDRPVYAGREDIDHPLQMNITYPLKYSKNIALLRLSIAGIIIAALPHLIIMSMLTITIPVVYLAGIITVLITRRWPNILFTYLTKYFRYLARISSFMTGLTDEYPPFNFD